MTCPSCKADKAHRSHRASLNDRVRKFFGFTAYRCHACNARFYAYRDGEKSDRLRTREEQRIMQLRRRLKWRKSKIEITAFAVCFAAFLVILYLVLQQRMSTE